MVDSHRYFYLRRLHSLLGVFPLGVFLVEHLLTNSTAFHGPDDASFIAAVSFITSLPALPFLEAFGIFIPLVLHIVLGIAILRQGRSNLDTYRTPRNFAYTLQRLTGWIAFAYIVYHTATLRFMDPLTLVNGNYVSAGFFAYLSQKFQNPLFVLIYLVGGVSVIFHFANGLCTFCMTWGITVGRTSQRYMARLAIGMGAALLVLLSLSIYGMWNKYDVVMANLERDHPGVPKLTRE